MKLKVIFEDIIKPSTPTPNHLRVRRPSLIDQIISPVFMPVFFFYSSQKAITNINTSQMLYRLKTSLPKTLSIFYPFGGRVLNANYIDCNDEGVPYIEAEVEKPLLELKDLILKAQAITLLDKLLPPYGKEGYTSLLLAIQVNIFSCGGIVLGIKMNHVLSDGFSIFMFVKTWASIARGSNNFPHPYFDTWKVFPPVLRQKIAKKDVNAKIANHNPDLIVKDVPVTKLFLFSGTKLFDLRSKVFTSNSRMPSIAMVLSAFIWSRIIVSCYQCSGIDENIPHEIFLAVNLHGKVGLPNDHHHHHQSYYFGNMGVNAIAKSTMKVNDDNETLWLGEMVRVMYESIEKVRSDMFIRDIQQGKNDLRYLVEPFERQRKGEVVIFGLSNLISLPVYEADFGWGKPVWVTTMSLSKNIVFLTPAGPSSKDIVASISLSKEDMAKLERDIKFKTFVFNAFHDARSKL